MSFCVWKLEALQSNCNMCCSGNRLKRSPQRLMSPLSSSHSFLSCWFLAPLCPLLVLRSPASWRVTIYTHVSLSVVSSNTSVLLQSSQSSAVEENGSCFSGETEHMCQSLIWSCASIVTNIPLNTTVFPDGNWIQLFHYTLLLQSHYKELWYAKSLYLVKVSILFLLDRLHFAGNHGVCLV